MSELSYPFEYVADYAFELVEPIDGKHGGYATITFDTDKKVESGDDWSGVARQCFAAGEGKYKQVKVLRVGEVSEEDQPETLIEGQVIE